MRAYACSMRSPSTPCEKKSNNNLTLTGAKTFRDKKSMEIGSKTPSPMLWITHKAHLAPVATHWRGEKELSCEVGQGEPRYALAHLASTKPKVNANLDVHAEARLDSPRQTRGRGVSASLAEASLDQQQRSPRLTATPPLIDSPRKTRSRGDAPRTGESGCGKPRLTTLSPSGQQLITLRVIF
ncbi:hypothetical protein Salat_0625600 [Sesamum alatum]|uniref:Uncharacterized protein n=1 Tax=Sesamum alatum TaxID=300844 RepID=A0AAE2CU75_9LAMI|nr:hypothetical protein Salat_0625600 [Sesamum alatum]